MLRTRPPWETSASLGIIEKVWFGVDRANHFPLGFIFHIRTMDGRIYKDYATGVSGRVEQMFHELGISDLSQLVGHGVKIKVLPSGSLDSWWVISPEDHPTHDICDRFLREHDVKRAVGFSHATLFKMAKAGRFPAPRQLGKSRRKVWLESEVREWMVKLPWSEI